MTIAPCKGVELTLRIGGCSTQDIVQLLEAIKTQGEQIMSKVSEFADAQEAFNAAIQASVEGLTGDIAALNNIIAALPQPAEISVEDQARLDALKAVGQVIADKLAALDALTPPVAPPVA